MVLDARQLQSNVNQALMQLKQEAKDTGKRISSKPKKGYVCVLSALEELKLDAEFISDFQKLFPPIKAHRGKIISSLALFVRSNGGINYSVERVREYLNITVIDATDTVSTYANAVYGSLLDVKSCTSRRYLRKTPFSIPYCAFCWRRVEDSAGYCQIHHPNQSKRSFYKAKSALESALKHTESEYLGELQKINDSKPKEYKYSTYAFKWTASFAKHPRYINRDLIERGVNSEINDENLSIIAGIVLRFIKKEYPKTYIRLPKSVPDNFASWQDFTLFVLKALDPIEAAFWEAKDIEAWMNPGVGHPNIFVLLMVTYRHEAFQVINSFERPRGPKKGAELESKNNELRKKIRDLAKLQLSMSGKINRAEIGRELSISRQRVSVLMSETTID
ncbi:hypothetical protein PVE41_09915 [Vibrio vulnificus]|uniref:Uncharacterized protein n=1 Tax=Vibrio xiamenensis TaxID=861298 RepID=A0A1G8EZV7_9VIBR|nr:MULTISPECIES: hypothetical protein [Vibrio]EHH1246067.1 hypothetical protein [Vibrio parahaemolyticus]WHE20566.1 hypothetical protein PVE41_09915 [Vibrio vulnificus]SDH75426.1 hypothetical protein SAMN04488136_12775 [Vibrio xiamenensis]HAS6207005.1 hypothetical protein [Vibrio vulnificus]HAT8496021.1 hypothetical protein [Vibrio vulnificus]